MAKCCEVCASLASAAAPPRRLQRFLVESRVLSLCAEHAHAFRERRPDTLLGVTELFREETGERSLVSRRAPIERRQFPLRPEGRRRTAGRRSSDAG
jgi:hypothetical protein